MSLNCSVPVIAYPHSSFLMSINCPLATSLANCVTVTKTEAMSDSLTGHVSSIPR